MGGTIKGTPQKGCKAKVSNIEGTTTGKRRQSQTPSQNVNTLGQSSARKGKKLKYEPQQRLNKQPTFCYRSNIAGIVKLVAVSKLKDKHLQHLQKTPFWLLLDAMRKTDLNQHEFQKCDDIVMRINQTFVPEKSAFMVGGKHIELTRINMQPIFGIQGGKKSLKVSHGPRLPTKVSHRGKCDSKQEMEDEIIEVDNIADPDRTFSWFNLTNRLPIWKLLSTEEKDKLKKAYEKGGDSAQVWTGPHVSNSVSFNDIRAIVKGLTLRGNVIDAYAEMLMYEQQMKAPKSANDEELYIFSTLCLPTIRDVAKDVRDRYLALRAPHALKARYIQFLIHLDNHWTLMVYDTEERFWLHYNSMEPRRGREDKHYWEASLLMGTVETQDLVKELLVVDYCPQQKPDSNDCGIIVCFIMKQLVRHLDVDKSMEEESCRTMRAGMVKSFVNDRIRSFVAVM
ncbi:unnamed protein product [Camellia sinensis]